MNLEEYKLLILLWTLNLMFAVRFKVLKSNTVYVGRKCSCKFCRYSLAVI